MDAQSSISRTTAGLDGSRHTTNLPLEVGRLFGVANREAARHHSKCRIGAVHSWAQRGREGFSSGQRKLREGMMRDKLSKREDRALLRALREVVLTHYPNLERKDCPGTPVIKAIATKRISMFDPAHEHVVSCSPCFRELTEMRRRLQRRNILLWAMATTGTAIAIAAVLLSSGVHRMNNSIRKDTVQTGPSNDSQPPAQPREAVQPGPVVPAPPPPQPKYEVALLDLHN